MAATDLPFLPAPAEDWRTRLAKLSRAAPDGTAWTEATRLARFGLNFTQAGALDTVVRRLFPTFPVNLLDSPPERLAVLSSATTRHLLPAIRIAGLRRGLWIDIFENDYGLYRETVLDDAGPLAAFNPTSVLFAIDAEHATRGSRECRSAEEAGRLASAFVGGIERLWGRCSERFGAQVLQQALMPRLPGTMGGNEHRDPGSAAALLRSINIELRRAADRHSAGIVALDDRIALDGMDAWFSRPLWFKSKQEIAPSAAPLFGETVVRQIAVRKGRAAKCCVFDLDNTLWGGVVGDLGPDHVVVGQGSAEAEAFSALQDYGLALRRRGILLAVCSKNDDAVARAAFERNPNMTLKLSDFAAFVANWEDKPANLRRIARELNIGLDSLVFVDDNPFERELVRETLPMVMVPEVPADPALIPAALNDAGCFEALALTAEDFERAALYAPERRLPDLGDPATDLAGYLAALDMRMTWGHVDAASLVRVTQLINKTNQFNVTTRRYTEAQVRALQDDSGSFCLHFRLLDRFGDHGLIAVVIGRAIEAATVEIDSWLMSCRVLGRQVEEATLNVVAAEAKRRGARRLVGVYLPTDRNAMVADLFPRLGFASHSGDDKRSTFVLQLDDFTPRPTPVQTELTL